MNFTKTVMTLCLALFCFLGIKAEDVTPELAIEQAQSFLSNLQSAASGQHRAPGIAPEVRLQGKVSGLYVFNVENDGGFVIVSNDDRTIPVLGFSEKGSLDPNNMPSNMKAWLQGYADEIAWLQQHGSKASGPKKARGKVGSHSTDYIAPLLRTTWDQDAPYNNLCPTFSDDPYYGTGTCATGCVATAMAQVMKYHEWPYDETQSIPSYTSQSYNIDMPALPAITLDWANMKDDYSGSNTQDEETAVATLMLYCGCSVQMDYGPSSASYTDMVAYALKDYFDYNNSTVQCVRRAAYTYANWTDLIYHEIANARPVVYGGDSSGGAGHEFVCDGYMFADETDYFHINWGWSGLSDNYFVLSALDPYQQGIGGTDSGNGYNRDQDAVIGIQRSIDDGTIADVPTRTISLYASSITVCTPIAVVGQPVRAILNVHNSSEDEYDGEIGIARMGEGEGFNVEFLNTAVVYIPAGETKDCVIEFIPTKAGTYNLISFFPSLEYGTTFDGEIRATIDVLEEWNKTTNQVVPVYGLWCDQYSQSQFIIAEAYMQGMQDVFIKGMTFYAEQEDVSWGDAEFDVYLSEVSETTISELMDWNTLEKVYAGKLSISGKKMDISFDNAFAYHGGNLLIGINQTVQGSYIDSNWYGIYANEASYGGFWNITENTSQQNFLPIVSFDLMSASDSQKPTDLAVSDITSSSAVISWDGSADSYNLRYTTYTPGTVLFTEDFENGLDAQGWTVVRNGEGTFWTDWQKESATGFVGHKNHGGKWGAMARDWDGETFNVDNWLITPQLALGGTLTCWMYDMYLSAQCDIYVCTTAFDPDYFDESVFTKVYEPVNAYGEWTEQTIDLSAFTGQTGYIAFRHKGDVFFIDDVTVTGPIDLSDAWTTVPDVTSPYTLGGLAEDTSYMVEVQAVQGNVASEWVGITFTIPSYNPVPYNITADLAADGATLTWEGTGDFYIVRYRTAGDTEAVFFDDFENGLDQWTVYTEGESSRPNGWNSQTSSNMATALSGNHFASAWSTGCNADNWLVSPQMTLGKELRFWVYVNQYCPDSYEVRLSTTGNAITDFTEELQALAPAPDNGEWNEVFIDLSAFAGQTGYIAIRHACYDQNFLLIDDFGVYDYTTRTGDWEQMTAYDKTATLSGFATNTGYEYQIQSIREETASEWSTIQDFALLTLANDADNTSLINAFNGKKAHVTLAGRTLYKDGKWNTIFLPFDIKYDDLASTPLAGADFRSLTGNKYDGEKTTLEFSFNLAYWGDDFEGNYPHIIKWESGSDIVNPEFANVTIISETDYTQIYNHNSGIRVTFKGTYAPISFTDEDRSILFIGAGNKLNWPLADAKIGAMRCYFEIEGAEAGIKEFVTNLDEVEDPDGISEISDNNESHDWYDLSGRKLAGKPTMKGIYVNGGRKVSVK